MTHQQHPCRRCQLFRLRLLPSTLRLANPARPRQAIKLCSQATLIDLRRQLLATTSVADNDCVVRRSIAPELSTRALRPSIFRIRLPLTRHLCIQALAKFLWQMHCERRRRNKQLPLLICRRFLSLLALQDVHERYAQRAVAHLAHTHLAHEHLKQQLDRLQFLWRRFACQFLGFLISHRRAIREN